ncbi:MAG TPA: flagellar basal body-associated FliL family protein [Chloroflexota bacterium]|nr:flagellar basal body-associated FliL family protein [Chloroflexota bacterium]
MKKLLRAAVPGLAAALAILLSACGGSAAPVVQPSTFPTTANLPTLQIKDRVVNLNAKNGYQYAKMTLNVMFSDPKGEYAKAKGEALKKLQDTFAADNPAAAAAFNDVVTTDVSQKSPQELATADGKEALRQQLIKDFNARLAPPAKPGEPALKVLWVEYVDFVMQ